MASMFLRLDIRYIFFFCAALKHSHPGAVVHVDIRFAGSVSEVGKFLLSHLKLKSKSRKEGSAAAEITVQLHVNASVRKEGVDCLIAEERTSRHRRKGSLHGNAAAADFIAVYLCVNFVVLFLIPLIFHPALIVCGSLPDCQLHRCFQIVSHGLQTAVMKIKQIAETVPRSEEHTSELQSRFDLVCRLLLEK